MDCRSSTIAYGDTGYFSRIVNDYVESSPSLQPFIAHPVSDEGITGAIANRKRFPTNRQSIVDVLKQQYAGFTTDEKVSANINRLANDNSFAIITAHQPNIFTGHLYFIYKILHVIKIADKLNAQRPAEHFVPVFYMGSEDADLDELGNIHLGGEKLVWDTKQTGAVGRMKTKGLDKIFARIEGEVGVLPHGQAILSLLKEVYLSAPDVQTATLRLVDRLFSRFGLVVVIADHPALKREMLKVFEDDLFKNTPANIVAKTVDAFPSQYKVQASPRDINLFYLVDNVRGRIEKKNDRFIVHETNFSFSEEEMRRELEEHPERFSPNVILRGLFQETILPGIAFIGGGGELAYWLELKELFLNYAVPFPMLVLRNSFMLVEPKWQQRLQHFEIPLLHTFKGERALIESFVTKHSGAQLQLTNEKAELNNVYAAITKAAEAIDTTLQHHVAALHTRSLQKIEALEHKMMRAEKRKYEDQHRQLKALLEALFPGNGLQERVDNFIPYYAKYGEELLNCLYEASLTFEQLFVVIELAAQA
jgi:bacillithiol synthase